MLSFKEFILLESDKTEFGKYLFGEFKKFYGREIEKDSSLESKFFDLIVRFVSGEWVGKKKSKALLDMFDVLMKNKSKYPDILIPEETKLFRGEVIPRKVFETLVFRKEKTTTPEMKKIHKSNIPMYSGYEYKSLSDVQSWTPNYFNAYSFAREKGPTEVPVILSCDIPQNQLLFSSKFLNSLSSSYFGGAENEIIRISNQPLKCNLYVKISYLTKDQMKLFNKKGDVNIKTIEKDKIQKPEKSSIDKPIKKIDVEKEIKKPNVIKGNTVDDILSGLSKEQLQALLKKV